MARKRKHEEHVNHERWLVSYADFITLLFAFFVIMYALSEVDKNKLKKFSNAVQFAFSHVGSGGTQVQGKSADTFRPQIIGTAWPKGRRDSDPGPFESLTGIIQFLENSIIQWFLRHERAPVEVVDEGRGVLVRLPAERLFTQSSDTLRPDRAQFLAEFGEAVQRFNVSFRVRLALDLPVGGDSVREHDLGTRRLNTIVRSVRRMAEGTRARVATEIVILEQEDVETSRAEHSRSIFEFFLTP